MIEPGMTVTTHAPLDPERPFSHPYGGPIGTVINLRRNNGLDGAEVLFTEYTDWIQLQYLHPVDDDTYRRYTAARRAGLAKLAAAAKPESTTWRQRQDEREQWRADYYTAVHRLLMWRWGLAPDPRLSAGKKSTMPGPDGEDGDQLGLFEAAS